MIAAMKYLLTVAAIILTQTACNRNSEAPVAAPTGSTASSPAVQYSRGEVTRPADLPKELLSSTSCSIDRVNNAPRQAENKVDDKSKIQLNGWAANLATTTPPGPLTIELDGPSQVFVTAQRSIKRADVADAHHNPLLVDAGWEAHIDLSGAAPGKYRVRLLESLGAGSTACDPSLFLDVPS